MECTNSIMTIYYNIKVIPQIIKIAKPSSSICVCIIFLNFLKLVYKLYVNIYQKKLKNNFYTLRNMHSFIFFNFHIT